MTTTRPAAAEFVERFTTTWSDPSPDALTRLMHPDVVLVQPTARTMRGIDQARRGWDNIFALFPDLTGRVHRWAETEDALFVEMSLEARVARRPFRWSLVDRIVLEGGLVRERVSYFDPLPLVLESLRSPRRWPAMLRLMRGR